MDTTPISIDIRGAVTDILPTSIHVHGVVTDILPISIDVREAVTKINYQIDYLTPILHEKHKEQ